MLYNKTTFRILESAKDNFLHNGYQEASLKTICNQAGVTTGAFYHRFSGKEALYRAVVEPASKKLLDELELFSRDKSFSLIPEQCLVLIYLEWDIFRLIVNGRCSAYYVEFYTALQTSIYQHLLNLYGKYVKSTDLLLLVSKAYLASFLEIIRCDYDFDTAQRCIRSLDEFFTLSDIF